jgi:hypothetical protein
MRFNGQNFIVGIKITVMTKVKQKLSDCPPKVQEIINRANSLPAGYTLDISKFPEFDAEKQREWFFELVKTLPDKFIDENEWLQKVLNGETVSAANALKQKSGPFFERASKAHPRQHEQVWTEYAEYEGQVAHIYPLDALVHTILPAISCRRVLTNLTRMETNGVTHTIGGKPVLQGEILKNCHLVRGEHGIIEIGAHYPMNVIIGERVHTERIKLCVNCETFFWAKRLNKSSENAVCEKCSNTVRQRRFQSKKNRDLKQQRRLNYYYKKGYKEGVDFCGKCFHLIAKCKCDSKVEDDNNGTL